MQFKKAELSGLYAEWLQILHFLYKFLHINENLQMFL